MVIQIRSEAQQLEDTNGNLEEKIKELKVTCLFPVNTYIQYINTLSFLYYLGIHQYVFAKKLCVFLIGVDYNLVNFPNRKPVVFLC